MEDIIWDWCKKGGVKVNKMWPGFSSSGRGMHATSDIPTSDVLLLQIPTHLLFNAHSVRTDARTGFILLRAAESDIVLDPLATLLFGLLHEQSLGVTSKWRPFLASLPSSSEMITAQQFTLAELQTVPWAAELIEEKKIQQENLETAELAIKALLTWAERQTNDESMKITMQRMTTGRDLKRDLMWAWSVVSTRACYMDVEKLRKRRQLSSSSTTRMSSTTKSSTTTSSSTTSSTIRMSSTMRRLDKPGTNTSTLVPWLDLLNHTSAGPDHAAKAEWVAGRGFEVRSTLPLRSGEPIFLCYGNISNELLLSRYGFIDSAHPSDGATMHPVRGVHRLLSCVASMRRDGDTCNGGGGGGGGRGGGSGSDDQDAAVVDSATINSFCWSDSCSSCSGRMQTLSEAGLWPIESAGALSFLPTTWQEGADTDTALPVSWNLLTIIRVLTATNEIALNIKKMRSVVNDEELDKKSETVAWDVLRRLVAAELSDLKVNDSSSDGSPSQSPAKKKQKKEESEIVAVAVVVHDDDDDDGRKERRRLLLLLRDARKKILLSSSSAVARKCRSLSR